MKLKITVLFIAFISSLTIAQTKVGTIDSDYIIGMMPETKKVVEITKSYGAMLDSTFSIRVTDFKVRLEDYQAQRKGYGRVREENNSKRIGWLRTRY